jgi:hypothetical protein
MRRVVVLTALLLPAAARAEWIAWTPVRLGFTVGIDVPKNSDYILTDFRLDIAHQLGGAHVDRDSLTGSGPFVSLGGIGSLGLYTASGDATGCEDEVDPGDPDDPDDDTTRWTCGRLALGGAATVGWSWGSLLKSGYMLPEGSVYLQFAPYIAAVKRDDLDHTFELDFTASAGYWWSWGGIAARWSRVPGDDYYGVGLQLTKGFSEWFARDEKVHSDPETRYEPDQLPPVRIELGAGGAGPVHKKHDGAEATGGVHFGVYRRTAETNGPFVGLGGALTLSSTDAHGFAIGPAATIGQRGEHVGFYARARPLIGSRSIDDDARFDYGADGALGFSVTAPHSDDDGSDVSLGLEVTAAWLAGDVFVGGNVALLVF